MDVTKKQAYIIGGIALVGLGVGAYFLFFKKEKGEYDASIANQEVPETTLPSGVKVKATDAYKQELIKFSRSSKIREVTRAILTEMIHNWTSRNKDQIKSIIYNNIQDDEMMKVLKGYFGCHTFTGRWFANKRMDLVGWIKEVFSGDDLKDLLTRYPTLNYHINCPPLKTIKK